MPVLLYLANWVFNQLLVKYGIFLVKRQKLFLIIFAMNLTEAITFSNIHHIGTTGLSELLISLQVFTMLP